MKFRATVTTVSLIMAAMAPLASFSQNATQVAGQTSLASSMVANGGTTAELTSVVKSGNRVTIKVRFVEADPEVAGLYMLYPSLDDKTYENDFYLLAGDKKYLLLKDSEGKPLAPGKVQLRSSGKIRGVWYGTFPAPPDGESVMLFIPNIEPLGPFPISGA